MAGIGRRLGMSKKLSTQKIAAALSTQKLGATAVAQHLQISEPLVQSWLDGEGFPPPDKLLRLGALLKMPYSDLVIRDLSDAPVVAFRKARGTKTTESHYEEARAKGLLLKNLVPYIEFGDNAVRGTILNPTINYDFLVDVARKIRTEIGVSEVDRISFDQLITFFDSLHAVLIPVMWGSKKTHENAVHIFLPESRVTWIYLNLDVNLLDFKFWMAHELGHCLTPGLRGDEAEDFADAFAGALLFPHQLAEAAFSAISTISSEGSQLQAIKELSGKNGIAPFTIYRQINAYAQHVGKKQLNLEPAIHKVSAVVNNGIKPVSELLLGGVSMPDAAQLISIIETNFGTQFFSVFRKYINASQAGPGIVQTILGVSGLDARNIHSELADATV